ncbi:MAG: hypothetical protein US96_C0003G0004 [Candidatus Woesebacteria bacterium GW2011_GWB1_38_5b]|uniref:Uncharacterized protein n=1 Tax=Candidatus Woesebacteria bacterium GW2011_GWB1_38_5b TaxID=1618569 RepID=A0A0G0NFG1_9BACT|nr:MAG: hypothetical protein US96_C0003G0004 [Candidatus Woesebacteria bacterium GW2011_GWB1_38_5b]
MNKDIEPILGNQEVSKEVLLAAKTLEEQVVALGLDSKIAITPVVSKKGNDLILIDAGREFKLDAKSGLEVINGGNFSNLIRMLSHGFPGSQEPASTPDLLNQSEFAEACLSQAVLGADLVGNTLLNKISGAPGEFIPVYYGSTDGINFAEVLETQLCAQALQARGLPSYVIFDTDGFDSGRNVQNAVNSSHVVPVSLEAEFEQFSLSLGDSTKDRSIEATKRLTNDGSIFFASNEEVFDAVGKNLSIGKLALLARLAGGDPKLFDSRTVSDILRKIDSLSPTIDPQTPVNQSGLKPAGFSMYAREAVISAEFKGVVGMPLKLTTHANIYKMLGRYGSLLSQRVNSGAILFPIQRQRIQTRAQSLAGTDPVDPVVLAFLSEKFPEALKKLKNDFIKNCQVLTPQKAIETGTGDNRFIIEDYFPI